MGPAGLEDALRDLRRGDDPNLLVGPETCDDAGVYRLSDDLALVETVDVITPVCDDPYTFGRIAAANAVSDVYAMGGRPVTAMNLVFFPACSLPPAVLRDMLAGGDAALREAGVAIVGGHTVEDDELKYGLAVTGTIHPGRIIRNCTPQAGDRIILTKPIGTGIVATAAKVEFAAPEVVAEAEKWMTTLNRKAALLMPEGTNACTDVTGFGLLGHALEMAAGRVTLVLDAGSIPVMQAVSGLVADGMVPAGCYRNRDFYRPKIETSLADDLLIPLFDPQTSGGLMISLPEKEAAAYLAAADGEGVFAALIGEVTPLQGAPVVVR